MRTKNEKPSVQVMQPSDYEELKRKYRNLRKENRWIGMKLTTALLRNGQLREKLQTIAGYARLFGKTPIIDAKESDKKNFCEYEGLAECARNLGTYYSRVRHCLIAEGILSERNGTWVVNEAWQESGLFVYFHGVRNNYTRFFLKVTPAGKDFIREVLEKHSASQKNWKQASNG